MNTSDRTAEITAGFCLALASLSLGLCLPFAILTFVRIHPHGDAARAKPALWLKIAWVVLLLQVLLMFARMVLIYDDGAYVRLGLEGLRTTLQQLYLIHSLLSPPTLACVLVLQVRLAQAVREVSRMATTTNNNNNNNNNKTSGSLLSRLITVVGLGLIGLLSIVRFAVAEYNWAAQISYDVLPHIMNTLAAMDVLIAIFLLLGAIASLAYTIIKARRTPLRNVFFLLLAMTVLTVVRETFGIIYVGLVSLGQTVDVEMQRVVMEATPALNVLGMFFHPLTMVVCLILAWAVLGKKKERGGIWMDGQGVDKVLDEEGRSMSASTVRRLS